MKSTTTPYQDQRFWWLHELRRLRSALRIGTQASIKTERRAILKKLVELRASRGETKL